MDASARLNTGQCGNSIQSITWPFITPVLAFARKIRSLRFPSVPPKTRPRTTPHLLEVIRGAQYPIARMTRIAKTAKRIVPPVARLKAAPEFRVKVSLRRLPRSFLGSWPSRKLSAQFLLTKSVAHTSAATRRTLPQIGYLRRNVSAVLPSVCRACTTWRVGRLANAPCQLNCRTLRNDRRSCHRFARWHVPSEEPCHVH